MRLEEGHQSKRKWYEYLIPGSLTQSQREGMKVMNDPDLGRKLIEASSSFDTNHSGEKTIKIKGRTFKIRELG